MNVYGSDPSHQNGNGEGQSFDAAPHSQNFATSASPSADMHAPLRPGATVEDDTGSRDASVNRPMQTPPPQQQQQQQQYQQPQQPQQQQPQSGRNLAEPPASQRGVAPFARPPSDLGQQPQQSQPQQQFDLFAAQNSRPGSARPPADKSAGDTLARDEPPGSARAPASSARLTGQPVLIIDSNNNDSNGNNSNQSAGRAPELPTGDGEEEEDGAIPSDNKPSSSAGAASDPASPALLAASASATTAAATTEPAPAPAPAPTARVAAPAKTKTGAKSNGNGGKAVSVASAEQLLAHGPVSSGMHRATLRFTDRAVEAGFWSHRLEDLSARLWHIFWAGLLLAVGVLAWDVVFYLTTWKDAQFCGDLFDPACRSLGFRIVVTAFFVPALGVALLLHTSYARALYDPLRRRHCLACARAVPVDLAFLALLAIALAVLGRTISDKFSSMPVDYGVVVLMFLYFNVAAAYLAMSFPVALLSGFVLICYIILTLVFASLSGDFLYSADYALASPLARWSSNSLFSQTDRAHEVAWALFWPICGWLLAVYLARMVEVSQRKAYALLRNYAAMVQQRVIVQRQRNELWNELRNLSLRRLGVDPASVARGAGARSPQEMGFDDDDELYAAAGGGAGGIDFTSPAERAMQLLGDIQGDQSISNEVLLKARQVGEILMHPTELFTPPLKSSSGRTEANPEVARWVAGLVDPAHNKAGAAAGGANNGEDDEEEPADGLAVRGIVDDDGSALLVPALAARLGDSVTEPDLKYVAQQLDMWEGDIVSDSRVLGGDGLVFTGVTLFRKHDLLNRFQIDPTKLTSFLVQIQGSYLDKPFHNSLRAADVMRNVHVLLTATPLGAVLTDSYVLALFLAAACIDVGHPGIDSSFHIEAKHELALLYNDNCVLENYHAAMAFRTLMAPKNNVLSSLTRTEAARVRRIVIELILATDVSVHFDVLGQHKSVMAGTTSAASANAAGPLDPSTVADATAHKMRISLCKLALKASDVGYFAKPTHIHNRWAVKLYEEYFKQGDQERKRGLAISPFMDRETTSIAAAQLALVDYIVEPLYDALFSAIGEQPPEAAAEGAPPAPDCLGYIAANRAHWALKLDEEKAAQRRQEQEEQQLRQLSND